MSWFKQKEELEFLRGKVKSLEAHILWLDNHVNRHDRRRIESEERLDEISKSWLKFVTEQKPPAK